MSEVNYGPPLRFKAVDIETGKVLDNMHADFSYSTENQQILIKDCHYSSDLDPYEAPHSNIKLYQSTGFKDKNGQEVFFGDVLFHELYECLFSIRYSQLGELDICSRQEKRTIHLSINDLEHMRVIGNTHTSQEVLDQQ